MQDQRRYDANNAHTSRISQSRMHTGKGSNKREYLPTLVLQKPGSSSLTNFRFTSFSAVLVRDATPVKGHSALFRSGHLTSLSHSFLSKTAPSNKPRNRDGRLRKRNEQYISPLPSFHSRFPCSSLIFPPSSCFFLLSISLSPPSHSLGCLLDPSPFFSLLLVL